MGKLGALLTLLVVAAVIYFFNPNKPAGVSSSSEDIPSEQNTSQLDANQIQQSISLSSKNSTLNTGTTPIHHHDHHSQESEIPQYIKDSLNAKRIPASELIIEEHADGSATLDLKGQFQHVPVAILGEDGKIKIVETTLQPEIE